MKQTAIKQQLTEMNIFLKEDHIYEYPSVIGYEKVFKWKWMATQLNTFIVASDFGDEAVTVDKIEAHLSAAFAYAKQNYTGWPRGLQSGLGVITIISSSNLTPEAIAYCEKLDSGKKWAGFTIPVVIDSKSNTVYKFDKKPMWGRVYYPHFEELIAKVTG